MSGGGSGEIREKRWGGGKGKSNRIAVRELRMNATRMGAEERLGMSGCFWPRQCEARSADRLTYVVRNQRKADLTWAGLPYHIWKEGKKISDPVPASMMSAKEQIL